MYVCCVERACERLCIQIREPHACARLVVILSSNWTKSQHGVLLLLSQLHFPLLFGSVVGCDTDRFPTLRLGLGVYPPGAKHYLDRCTWAGLHSSTLFFVCSSKWRICVVQKTRAFHLWVIYLTQTQGCCATGAHNANHSNVFAIARRTFVFAPALFTLLSMCAVIQYKKREKKQCITTI